eukprot:scaffold10590_cov81-Isochrysis_galbana.AAC.3
MIVGYGILGWGCFEDNMPVLEVRPSLWHLQSAVATPQTTKNGDARQRHRPHEARDFCRLVVT